MFSKPSKCLPILVAFQFLDVLLLEVPEIAASQRFQERLVLFRCVPLALRDLLVGFK